MVDDLILVDDYNQIIGYASKSEVHNKGLLHRAFSIFVFNDHDELLIQKRNKNKYHSGGLWSNTCCSHPIKNEKFKVTLNRRLLEEMGIKSNLTKIFDFKYSKEFSNGLIENEYDLVFIGKYNGLVIPNHDEIHSYKWVNFNVIKKEINKFPEKYTHWFKLLVEKVFDNYYNNK